MPISDQKLIEYDKLGLIPGPTEDEFTFLRRAEYCLELKETLAKETNGHLPLPQTEQVTAPLLDEGLSLSERLYGIAPTWIPLALSNEKLAPWHGGCAWIFQWKENSPLGALLQLRKGWQTKKRMFGMYKRNEVIAHELAHVGRMAFEEPKNEELFAFQSSSSWLHRILGPIVNSSIEAMALFLLLFFSLLGDLFLISTGSIDLYVKAQWLKLIPLGLVGWWGIRLWLKHKTQKRCLAALGSHISNSKWLLYRLTDKEIYIFGKMNFEKVLSYAENAKKKTLRWQLLYKRFFE